MNTRLSLLSEKPFFSHPGAERGVSDGAEPGSQLQPALPCTQPHSFWLSFPGRLLWDVCLVWEGEDRPGDKAAPFEVDSPGARNLGINEPQSEAAWKRGASQGDAGLP